MGEIRGGFKEIESMKLDRNIERIVIFCKKIEKVSLLEHFLNITREVIKNVGIQEEQRGLCQGYF